MEIILFLAFVGIFIFLLFYGFIKGNHKKVKIDNMISDKYKEVALKLITNNNKLTEQRKRHNLFTFIKGIFGIAAVGSVIYMLSSGSRSAFYFPVLAIIVIIVLQFCEKGNEIFDEIIPSIIQDQFEGFTYSHKDGIDGITYSGAGFERYDRFRSDDLIEGTVCGYNFIMSEVHTEREYRDKDGHRNYVTIFHGTFSKVNLNKNLGCFINIVNNKIKLFSRDYYTTIDNEAFEKIYDVFTDDKIKALRLLTPDVTTKMIDLYNDTGIYCEIKIMGTVLYIRLYTGPLFNFSLSSPEKEALMVGKSLAVIDSVLKVMENFIKEVEEFDV